MIHWLLFLCVYYCQKLLMTVICTIMCGCQSCSLSPGYVSSWSLPGAWPPCRDKAYSSQTSKVSVSIYTIHRRKIVWFWSKQNVLNCKACCVTACVSSLGWMQTFRCAKRYCLWEKSHFSILHLVFSVHTEMLTFSNMLPPCSAIYSVSSR